MAASVCSRGHGVGKSLAVALVATAVIVARGEKVNSTGKSKGVGSLYLDRRRPGKSRPRSDWACNPRYVRVVARGQNNQSKDSRPLYPFLYPFPTLTLRKRTNCCMVQARIRLARTQTGESTRIARTKHFA